MRPGVADGGRVRVFDAMDVFQLKGGKGFQSMIPTPPNPVELPGGQYHPRPMAICMQPSHTDRNTRVEFEVI